MKPLKKQEGISDEQYYSIMEQVAKDNWQLWGEPSEDVALTRILNDNVYDYRGYYNKYPQSQANSNTHWTDEFKTAYHPTFSNESRYSGKKSKFNPLGLKGGYWDGDLFHPQSWQRVADYTKQEMPTDALSYNPKPSVYLGDDKVAQQLFNDRLKAESNAAYGVFRFLPWTKYVTDYLDVHGYSPDISSPDITDVATVAAPILDKTLDHLREDALTKSRIGRKINQFYHPKSKRFVSRGFNQRQIDAMNDQYQKTAGMYKKAKRMNAFRVIDKTFDIQQEMINLHKLYNAQSKENKYSELKARLDPQFKYAQ